MDRPNSYDHDGLPSSFGRNREGNLLPKPASSQSNNPSTSPMSSPNSHQVPSPRTSEHSTENSRSPTNATHENTTSPPSRTVSNPTTHHAHPTIQTSPSVPIPIRHPRPYNDPFTLSMPIGRPPPRDRNTRNLTISTAGYNPFLHSPAPTPTAGSRAGSTMGTPTDSPTTPDRMMMFKMDMSARGEEFPGAEDMRGRGRGRRRREESEDEKK